MKPPKRIIEKLELQLAHVKRTKIGGKDTQEEALEEIQNEIEALLKEKQAVEEEVIARDSEVKELELYLEFLKGQE